MEDLPPSYGSLFNEHRSGISYIDFLPYGVKGGFFSKIKYDKFGSVVDCANEWLRLNPQWEIKTCESIEFKDKRGNINPSKMYYFENTRASITYIRGLRLWLKIFPPGDERVQKIGYINLVPRATTSGGVFIHAKYENLDDVLYQFNQTSRTTPLPGRIITIETQAMKIKSGGYIDPDRSSWTEKSEYDNRYINVIRIFYEFGNPLYGEIGLTDFVPDMISSGCFSAVYENFSTLFENARRWCSCQTELRICNIQSLATKVPNGATIDTRKMSYTEHEGTRTTFIRTLRVAHIRQQPFGYPSPITFSCKSFVPCQLKPPSIMNTPTLESLQEVMQRVSNWVQATGADVLNIETSAVRLSKRGPGYSSEKTYFHDTEHRECFMYLIRAYLKGSYNEPQYR